MKEQSFENSNILGYVSQGNEEGVIYTDEFDISIFCEDDGDSYEISGRVSNDEDITIVVVEGEYKAHSIVIEKTLMNLKGYISIDDIDYSLTGSRFWVDGNYIDVFFPPKKI